MQSSRFFSFSFRPVRGGTLLEVLVSLLIITLVASTVVEIAGQRRRALVHAARAQVATNLATQWQTARLTKQAWAQGTEGGFPDDADHRWILEPVAASVGKGTIQSDAGWCRLAIVESRDLSAIPSFFVLRLVDQLPPVVASSATGGSP